MNVTVNAVNDAPVFSVVDNQDINEGGTKVILLSAIDIDEDDLVYNITDGVDITSSIDGSTVTFSLENNDDYFGSEDFTVSVTDGEFTESQTFTVTVSNVNDAPVLASVSNVSFNEDGSSETLTLSATDPDLDDILTYSIVGGDQIVVSQTDNEFTFTASPDFNGTETFTVSVYDLEYTDSQIMNVTVNAVNDAPVFSVVDNQDINEGGTKVILLSAIDIDEDDLVYNITDGVDITSSIDGSTVTFSLENNDDYFGSEDFTVSVTDGEFTESQTFTVTVSNVNDAPVLASVSNVSFNEDGSSETLTLSATDPDLDDILTYSIVGGDQIVVSQTDNEFTFTASPDFNGTETFTVSVHDLEYTDSQIMNVTVNAVNDTPVFSVVDNQDINEGGTKVILLSAIDIDEDDLVYNITDGVDITSSIDGSIVTFSLENNDDYFGSEDFTVSVTDGEFTESQTFTVTVTNVNDAPVLSYSVSRCISFDEDTSSESISNAIQLSAFRC